MEITYSQLERFLKSLESIARSLEKIASPEVEVSEERVEHESWDFPDTTWARVGDTVPTKNPPDVTQEQFDDAIEGLRKEQRPGEESD